MYKMNNILLSVTLLILSLILSVPGCTYAGDNALASRPPAVAGGFYPDSKDELAIMVDNFLGKVHEQKIAGKVIALVAPHAGYVYSGRTAAYSYSLISGMDIKNVIIIGNSHNVFLKKGAVYPAGSFSTPLGPVAINEKLAGKLISGSNLLEANIYPHKPEHSLEVQLPFLQRSLKSFQIVPILLSGSFSLENCRELGETIARVIKELEISDTTLIIASTDMSHYPSWANANMADGKALKILEEFKPETLKKTVSGIMSSNIPNESCVFCGEESLYTTMYAAKALGADKTNVLHYANSADVTGDKSRVVGYGAIAFTNSGEKTKKGDSMDDFKISEKSQKELLKIARESISYYLKNKKLPEFKITDKELTAPAAVFVTLTKDNKQLRGCIGTTEPQGPLYEAVSQMAVAAAVQDYRFPTVSPSELKDIHIEISILSPMRRIKNPDEIKPNIHGVVVRKGSGRGGLFLPQVWEHFDTKEGFMGELCEQKAGISRDAWKKPDTEIYVFTVFAFEEK